MPTRPDDPQDLNLHLQDMLRRIRALERIRLQLPEDSDALQTFENGSPLGDTRFLDFGAGINASLVGDDYVLVEGASGGSRWGTVVVAASDTHAAGKEQADFVCTGTADQTTLDLALDAAPSGGEIVLLEGTYQLTANWIIDEANIKVRGMGAATVIRVTTGFTGTNAIQVSANKVWIDSVAFIDSTAKTKWGVHLGTAAITSNDCAVTRCQFTTWDVAVGSVSSSTSSFRLRIQDCLFDSNDDAIRRLNTPALDDMYIGNRFISNTGQAIRSAGDKSQILGNHITDNTGVAIYSQAKHCLIQDNYILGGAEVGIQTEDTETQVLGNTVATRTIGIFLISTNQACVGNTVADCSDAGIYCAAGEQLVSNNLVSSCLRGVHVDSSNIVIESNFLRDCDQEGIHCDRTATRTNITIVGNYVFRCSQQTNNTYDAIMLRANFDECNIQGNTVRHGGAANQHRYGINIANANCDNNLVCNNDLLNSAATGNFNDAGTGTRACTGGGLAGGGVTGAPASADYLVGTANAGLSAEIVVGPTPGGELGNTWAAPTVDPIHSDGTAHADYLPVAGAPTGWGSVTNVTPDQAYDADSTTVNELADVLGTLIADLVARGVLDA